MISFRRITISSSALVFVASILFCNICAAKITAQTKLTYPELNTALKTKLPNRSFANKTELLNWLISQIKNRKVDKPLTSDREDDLRQAGATDELLSAIRANSPSAETIAPAGPVDLGDLIKHAVNLVKPEYTSEALAAGTTGEVKLSLELDEQGRVTSVSRLTVLPNGLTERAIDAAKQSTFIPASRNGKPARGVGLLSYTFKININVAATLAAANAFRDKMDCEHAIPEYTKVLGVDTKNARALFGRGSCYLMNREQEKALADIGSAAKLAPSEPEIMFLLGVTLDFNGEPAAGASAYASALKLRPDYDNQPTFACLYIDRNSMTPEQARAASTGIINNCNQAIRTANGQFESLLNFKRGIAYRLKGDYDRAIADFENVRRSNPEMMSLVNAQFLVLYNNRGLEAFSKKDYKKALDDITLAIQADPKNPTPYINRCTIYLYGWKQADEAIKDCSEAIRLATKSSMAFNHRGYAYELKNRLDEAAADYQTAVQMDPKNDTARTNLERLKKKAPSLRNP